MTVSKNSPPLLRCKMHTASGHVGIVTQEDDVTGVLQVETLTLGRSCTCLFGWPDKWFCPIQVVSYYIGEDENCKRCWWCADSHCSWAWIKIPKPLHCFVLKIINVFYGSVPYRYSREESICKYDDVSISTATVYGINMHTIRKKRTW